MGTLIPCLSKHIKDGDEGPASASAKHIFSRLNPGAVVTKHGTFQRSYMAKGHLTKDYKSVLTYVM